MIYQISSGQGPAECELGVAKLLAHLQQNYDVSIIDSSPGYNEGTFRSVRIYSESDLSPYLGSVQWVCRSPYRPEHKRKNWFIDFSACAVARVDKFEPDQVVLIPSEAVERVDRMSIRLRLASAQSICLPGKPWSVPKSEASTLISRKRLHACKI